jgi:hypothetical protein
MDGCSACGVAFDVGRRTCAETDCRLFVAHEAEVKKKRVSRSNGQTATKTRLTSAEYAHRRKAKESPEDRERRHIYSRLNGMRRRCEMRGWEFGMTEQVVRELIATPCVYCGGPHHAIDRKDNAVGYIPSNTVSSCHRCNNIKCQYLTYDQMMIVAKALDFHNNPYEPIGFKPRAIEVV